jgi:hypothetical protein
VKHNKQKIKLWNIPNKAHCSFDKFCINFPNILFMASRPNDKPILAIDDQIDLPITIRIMLQMHGYIVRMIDKRMPDYL